MAGTNWPGQVVQRDRAPHQRGADGRQQRQERHQEAPQHRAVDAEQREGDAADEPLRRRDRDVALDGGADHGGELAEQLALVAFFQGDGVADHRRQFAAVPDQEEKQIHHHREADQEVEGVLAEVDGRGGEVAAALVDQVHDLGLQRAHVADAEALEQAHGPLRQMVENLLQVAADVDLARLQLGVKGGGLLRQRGGDERRRQDHDHQDQAQRGERRQVGATVEALAQPAKHRAEQHRQDGPPENRAVIGKENPAESQRDADQQQDECFLFYGV